MLSRILLLAAGFLAASLYAADFTASGREIPLPENFLPQWKSASALLEAAPHHKGVLFSYRGTSQQAVQAFSQVLPVKPGMYLRLDYHFFKHQTVYALNVH